MRALRANPALHNIMMGVTFFFTHLLSISPTFYLYLHPIPISSSLLPLHRMFQLLMMSSILSASLSSSLLVFISCQLTLSFFLCLLSV
ncbi:hypothetical protein FKM82_015797 [Ascaphus truei]